MEHPRLTARHRGSEPEAVRVWMLGGFRVSVGNRNIGEDGWRRKAGSLVKMLALAEGHRLHRERVADLLWPDLDAKHAANNLHFARKALQPADIALRDGLLSLCPDGPLWVDVEAFEAAAIPRLSAGSLPPLSTDSPI